MTVRALLDTHAWLWMLTEPARLGDARSVIEDPDSSLFLSAASSWEIAIKYSLGRLPLPEPPHRYVPERIRSSAVTSMPIEHAHTLAVAALPHHHRDPFDRILIAQAMAEGMPILTADRALAAYEVDVILVG